MRIVLGRKDYRFHIVVTTRVLGGCIAMQSRAYRFVFFTLEKEAELSFFLVRQIRVTRCSSKPFGYRFASHSPHRFNWKQKITSPETLDRSGVIIYQTSRVWLFFLGPLAMECSAIFIPTTGGLMFFLYRPSSASLHRWHYYICVHIRSWYWQEFIICGKPSFALSIFIVATRY